MLSLAIASVPAELPPVVEQPAPAVISPMVAAANMVEVAALVGDTARATILAALMGGQALTASELAYLAGVTRPTASEHLVKLVAARLLAVTRQGRFRYYRIASPLVARMLESIIAVAAIEVPPRYQPRSAATRRCASRAPATTIWLEGSASRSPRRWSPAGISSSARTAARSPLPARASSPTSAPT
jgi:DNA-binding transcriptional ArsR family regulator